MLNQTNLRWVEYFLRKLPLRSGDELIPAAPVSERAIIAARSRLKLTRWGQEQVSTERLASVLAYEPTMPGWQIDRTHTNKGLTWIAKNRNRKALKYSERGYGFRAEEWTILENFDHFLFMGFDGNPFKTVYRVVAKNGLFFDYYYDMLKGRTFVIYRKVR